MTTRPSTSAVVATYNRAAALPEFLDRLLACDELDEVVVAVDGSEDGSMDLLRARAEQDGRVTPVWVEHRGQFGAIDAGAKAAWGEVLLFLDDDIQAHPDLVSRHLDHHVRSDRLVVLGHMPARLPDHPPASAFATVLYQREYERRCRSWEADPAQILRHLWGGNFSMRRDDYLSLGYAPMTLPEGSPDIRLYNQDQELGLRCLDAGLRGVFDRHAAGVHLHERSIEGFLRDTFGQGACAVLLASLHPEHARREPTGRAVAALDRLASTGAGELGTRCAAAAVRASVAVGSLRAAIGAARAARRVQIARGAAEMQRLLAGETPPAGNRQRPVG